MISVRRLVLCLLLTAIVPWQAPAAAEDERDLEPLPRSIIFTDPAAGQVPLDIETDREGRSEIQRSFASLGGVVRARYLLVRRMGLVAVPALVDVLNTGKNVAELWNAALTIGAMRDQEGPAYELKTAPAALLKVLRREGDVHTNAMAALALGCFHFHEARLPARYGAPATARYSAVPGIARQVARAAAALDEARDELARRIDDPLQFMRLAAMFALAKMGGTQARDVFLARKIDLAVNPELPRAHLLASAFLGVEDGKPCLDALDGRIGGKASSTIQKASAALASAVAMVREDPAAWARDVDRLRRGLRDGAATQATELAERIFARGVLAHVNQLEDVWLAVWKVAILTSTNERVAAAAAQILAHCQVPAVERDMVRWTVTPPKTLPPAVRALVLLRSGAGGRPVALGALASWLKNRARRPAANARWDPRWYAVIGLLRALRAGAIRPQAERRLVVEALHRAVASTLDKDAPIYAPLKDLLVIHATKLVEAEETSLYLLPADALERVESSFTCPYGLLARDVVGACVHRVNAMVYEIFNLKGITWKQGGDNTKQQPERYLKRYLEAYPYFTRLEFLAERGHRAPAALPPGVEGIDR